MGVSVVVPVYNSAGTLGELAERLHATLAGLGREYELVLVYLIRDAATRAVETSVDRHRCGLFAESDWLSFLAEANFSARRIEDDKAWTLFAGTKRAP